MAQIVLNTVALDPLRWSTPKRNHFSLAELIGPISLETRFRGLEIWQYHLTDIALNDVEALQLRLAEAQLTAEVVGLYPVLCGSLATDSMAECKRLIDVAAVLGAKSVKIFVGDQPSADISDGAWEESLRNLDALIRAADSAGVALNGENHQNTLFDDVLSLTHTMAAVGEGRMGVCFQPYDFTDSHHTLEVLRKLAPDVRHVHFQGRALDGEFCLLEDAPIDYPAFMSVLKNARFDGPMSIEFVKDCVVASISDFDLELVLANAEKDRRFLERTAGQVGLEIR